MLRTVVNAALRTAVVTANRVPVQIPPLNPARFLSLAPKGFPTLSVSTPSSVICTRFLQPVQTSITQERTVTKFSLNKGKRKSVKAVLKRFKRLDWGCWIRTHSGRHKKLFKKSPALRRRLRQHILVNASQSWLLDKMVTRFWRKPKRYLNDPYEPYHKREEYWATRTKPIGS